MASGTQQDKSKKQKVGPALLSGPTPNGVRTSQGQAVPKSALLSAPMAVLLAEGNGSLKASGHVADDDIEMTDKKGVVISLLALVLSVPALIGA